MGRLEEWAGSPAPSEMTDLCRGLEATELAELALKPLVAIGSHTVSHPVLARLDEKAQLREIQSAKLQLESVIGRSVPTFSYPFGAYADFNSATLRALARAGVKLACANYPGLVSPKTGPYVLPRFLVRDCDGQAFEAFLKSATAWPKPGRLVSLKAFGRRYLRRNR